MTKRFAVWVVILVLSAVALLMVVNRQPHEPVSGGKPLSYWLPRLDNRSDLTARSAIKEMGANALPYLIQTLRQLQPAADQSRVRVLQAIACLGQSGIPALPDILPLLTNQSYQTKIWAIFILGAVRPDTQTVKSAVPVLFQALEDPESTIRLAAMDALSKLRPPPSEAAPALVQLLKDDNQMVRETALHYLVEQTNTAVIPILDKQLHGKDSYVITTAASQIGVFGAAAAGSEPRLKELLNYPISTVREAATNALAAITGQPLSHSTPNVKADITFLMPGSPLLQILDIYESLAGKKVAIAETLQQGQLLRVRTVRPLTKSEALQLLDEVLKEQAGLLIIHEQDGSLNAVAMPSGQRTAP